MTTQPNFEKRSGLLPVIVQDAHSNEVLMLAYQNQEAWMRTIANRVLTLYSTSRKELWTKGETSGNFMRVVGIRLDCDYDAILYLVEPQGDRVACHTGARSCFFNEVPVSQKGSLK